MVGVVTKIHFSLLQAVFSAWLFSQGNQTALCAPLPGESLLSVLVPGLQRDGLIARCILTLHSVAGLEDCSLIEMSGVVWVLFGVFLSLKHSAPPWQTVPASELLAAVTGS